MPRGIMKQILYVVAAVGVTAAVFYVRENRHESPSTVPSIPIQSVPARPAPGTLPPLPTIPTATFPDIVPPPDGTLAISAATPVIPPAPTAYSPELPMPPVLPIPSAPLSNSPATSQPIAIPALEAPTTDPPMTFPGALPVPPSSPPAGLPVPPIVSVPPAGLPVAPIVPAPPAGLPVTPVVPAPPAGLPVTPMVAAPPPLSSVEQSPSSFIPPKPTPTTEGGVQAFANYQQLTDGFYSPGASMAPPPVQTQALGHPTIATRGYYEPQGNNNNTGVPVVPVPPSPTTVPQPTPVPLVPPKPPLPAESLTPIVPSESVGACPVTSFTPKARFIVLKGKVAEGGSGNKLLAELMACKLVGIEGISPDTKKNEVIIQQGAMVRSLPKADVMFAGETRDDVYAFMRDHVPPTDVTARLAVARWCMFNGMREQALTESRAILQIQPQNKTAAELARSLEESLKQFPPEGATVKTQSTKLVPATAVETELDITPEGATSFATRVQPILENLCIDCHARANYSGSFKLAHVTEFEVGPQTTQANLRATARQLLKSDPTNSPLLIKAISVHGGLKQPPFSSRQMAGFRALENWTVLAVGMGSSPPGGTSTFAQPLTQPAIPPTPMVPTSPSTNGLPTVPQVSSPGLPPVEAVPTFPATNTVPPIVSAPMTPSVPVTPPVVAVPPVLPTPPVLPPAVPSQPPIIPPAIPSQPPVIPPAGTNPKMTPPTIPMPPVISIPQFPQGVQPVSGSTIGSQFGTSLPQKPMSPNGSAGSDEFDANVFNQGTSSRVK